MKLKVFKNKKIGIVGFGIEGKAMAKFLEKFSPNITILDQDEKKKVPKKYGKILGKNYLQNLNQFEILILSPSVYPFKKEFKNFKGKIFTQTQIFFESFKGKIIGISGTKGKGTLATLIFKALKKEGKRAALAGNIGFPLINLLEKNYQIAVVELSSFQLMTLKKSPKIAVLLDIFPDHLNWHKNFKEYLEAKLNLIRFQNKNDFAIIDKNLLKKVKNIEKIGKGRKIFFDLDPSLKEKFKIKLAGEHNLKIISAFLALGKVLKIKKENLKKTIESFRPLPFHLQSLGKIGKVEIINDSASTNPYATIAAIRSFSQPKILILGGKEKKIDLKPLKKEILENKTIKAVICFGEVSKKLYQILAKKKEKYLASNLEEAILLAKKLAQENEIILFSPGFASLDLFKNTKERGKVFEKLVQKLWKKDQRS